VGPAFFEHAPQHEAMTFHREPDEVLAEATGVFKRHHYRTVTEDDGTVHLYAVRNNWAPWAGLVAHISIVVILAGAMVGSMFGFRDGQFMLAESPYRDSTAPARPSPWSVKDTSPTTRAVDYVSDVTVTGRQAVACQQVRQRALSGEELLLPGLLRPAAVMTVKDAAGTRSSPRACPSPGPPTMAATR
jgi:hypothetical protein